MYCKKIREDRYKQKYSDISNEDSQEISPLSGFSKLIFVLGMSIVFRTTGKNKLCGNRIENSCQDLVYCLGRKSISKPEHINYGLSDRLMYILALNACGHLTRRPSYV